MSSSSSSSSSGSGLSTMISPLVANTLYAAKEKSYFDSLDPVRELGLDLEEVQRSARLLALTNPGEYEKQRKTDWDLMKTSVKDTYDHSMKMFLKSGLPTEHAKALALQTANTVKGFSRQALELKFPSAANVIGDSVSISRSGAMPGLISGSAAPVKRRRTRRRR